MVKISKAFINNIMKDPEGVLKTLSCDDVVQVIQKANHEYYNKGKPLFPDTIFDIIKEYLASISPNHPALQHIGAVIDKSSENKVTLPFHMGSLDKIKSDEKVLASWISKYKGSYVVSDKLDGNSGLLAFSVANGLNLYTRGDGTVGQDISHLIPFLNTAVNDKLFSGQVTDANPIIAVRGELIISKENFAKISDKGANARNTVAGLLNAKVPDLTVAKMASFVAYEVLSPVMKPSEQMKYIKNVLKLPCVYSTLYNDKDCNVTELSKELMTRRKNSPYEIDGIVVTHNCIHSHVEGNPDHSFAFKSVLTMEKAEVTVLRVEWNMSKDGLYIPVVVFTPVSLDGVVITRAHGFNGKYIMDNSIGPGATIVIMRSGAVIPYIVETLVKAHVPQMPESPYVWGKSGVDIRVDQAVISDENRSELQLRNLEYFFDKIDIRGLSGGILAKIYKKGFTTVGKVLQLTVDELLTVEGFKTALAEKIHSAISSKKLNDPYLIMDASNILGRGIGYKKLKLICQSFPAIITERYIPTVPELVTIKGVEVTTAELFVKNLPMFYEWIDRNEITLQSTLEDNNIENHASPTAVLRVKDKTFVFSGVRDKDLEKFITENGGHITTSVSSKSSLMLVKSADSTSSKVSKAKELGIPIMTLDDFKKEVSL
jgi:NAD-dependent DNA ligase